LVRMEQLRIEDNRDRGQVWGKDCMEKGTTGAVWKTGERSGSGVENYTDGTEMARVVEQVA
jgi:hypothetical protein